MKKITSYKAILFDFDGVLAESMNVKTEAFAKLYESYGEEIVQRVVKHHIENGGISRYKKFEYYHQNYLNKNLSEEELEYLAQQFSDIVVESVIESEWVKGSKEFLEKYYDKIDMYVVSGTPDTELKLVVKNRDMNKYFKGIYGSPETKSELSNKIISEKGYKKDDVVYIGDSMSDYTEAEKAEIPFLGRLTEEMTFSFPEKTTVFNDFTELNF